MAFFSDLLKTDNLKFSQARVYLFASVVVYFLTITIYLSHAFFGIISDVNVLMNIMNSLQYMMLIFASYSLVWKGLSSSTIKERLEMHSKFTPPPMTPINDGRQITPVVPHYQRNEPEYTDFYEQGGARQDPRESFNSGGYRDRNEGNPTRPNRNRTEDRSGGYRSPLSMNRPSGGGEELS